MSGLYENHARFWFVAFVGFMVAVSVVELPATIFIVVLSSDILVTRTLGGRLLEHPAIPSIVAVTIATTISATFIFSFLIIFILPFRCDKFIIAKATNLVNYNFSLDR